MKTWMEKLEELAGVTEGSGYVRVFNVKVKGNRSKYPDKVTMGELIKKAEESDDKIAFGFISLVRGSEADEVVVKSLSSKPVGVIPTSYGVLEEIKKLEDNESLVVAFESFTSRSLEGELLKINEDTFGPILTGSISVESTDATGKVKTSFKKVKKPSKKLEVNNMGEELKQELNRILREDKLDNKDNLLEKIDYLEKLGVTEDRALKIFKSYYKVPNEVKHYLKKPTTKYIETEDILKEALAYVHIGQNILFQGDKGVGKNILTQTIAWLYNRPIFEVSMNSQYNNESLLGTKTFKTTVENGKKTVKLDFEPEPVVLAAKYGGFLVLDEFNMALPHVLAIFNSMLEVGTRRIHVPGFETIDVNENTLVFATQNNDYQGTFEGNEATKDRFTGFKLPRVTDIKTLIANKVEGVDNETLNIAENVYNSLKELETSGSIASSSLSIRGFYIACKVHVEEDIPLKSAMIKNLANTVSDPLEEMSIVDAISHHCV